MPQSFQKVMRLQCFLALMFHLLERKDLCSTRGAKQDTQFPLGLEAKVLVTGLCQAGSTLHFSCMVLVQMSVRHS